MYSRQGSEVVLTTVPGLLSLYLLPTITIDTDSLLRNFLHDEHDIFCYGSESSRPGLGSRCDVRNS